MFRYKVNPIQLHLTAAALACSLMLATLPCQAGKIAEGTFISKESSIVAMGTFEVQETNGIFTLVIQSNFHVSEGPDLFFAFNPLLSSQVTGSNAKTSALKVDPGLKSLVGGQTYTLPNNFDLSKYSSLIVHCWKYDHLYATSAITKIAVTSVARQRKGKMLFQNEPENVYSHLKRLKFDLVGHRHN